MTDEGEVLWPGATERLRQDPAFGPVVEEVGPVVYRRAAPDLFAFLVRAVTYQQLAGAAAATIHGRVLEALGGEPTPERILATDEEALRGAGLSRAKHASIVDLATKVAAGEVVLDDVDELADAEVMKRLVKVRGIGPWTAQMALLFHLRRPDVWPVGDLGVRSGVQRVFGMDEPPTPGELELIGLGYRPWRSATAWYCWRAVEVLPPG